MTAVVVDASALLNVLIDPGDRGEKAASALAGKDLHAPDLLPYELGNVALSKLRQGQAEAAVRASLAELDALGVALHPVAPTAALDVAARYALTAYDAAYLALAAQLHCPLLTFDQRLAAAARQYFDSSA